MEDGNKDYDVEDGYMEDEYHYNYNTEENNMEDKGMEEYDTIPT